MILLALAIAPGIAICLYIFLKDIYNKEPRRLLLASFLLGVLSILPPFFIESYLQPYFSNSLPDIALFAFGTVALSEELSKFLVLRYYCFTRKSFDEPLDGIVYSVMVSMGFATLENINYVVSYNSYDTALIRMFLSVPAHATFAVVMGYFVGKAKFDPPKRFRYLLTGLFWAVVFHGCFDFFLFLQKSPDVKPYISDALLFLGALISYILAIRMSRKHIRLHHQFSKQLFMQTRLEIKYATENDIPLIQELNVKIWPQTYAAILSKAQIDYMLNLMYSKSSLLRQMNEEGCTFILIYENHQPVGFASYGEVEPGVWKLHKIYILPNQQGKGTGRFVLEHIYKSICTQGARALRLQVNRYNSKAKKFYEKQGFRVIQTADFDIGNGYFMNDFVMEKIF